MESSFRIPPALLTDSYKAAHHLMYPEADLMSAYGEFRVGYNKDKSDTRFVFYGIRYLIENYVARKWTLQDVERSERFFNTHNAGYTPYPFPKGLFLKFIEENDGYFPVVIQALPEGTVANVHVPVFQITATHEYARLVTYLETILTQIWYPSSVATLSRRVRDLVDKAFETSVDEENHFLRETKLQDFGFRGCTSVEQSIIGGCAHLLNFTGTDTMSAAYYAQYELNDGNPIGSSIPASEHSVMTSWLNERDAIDNMIDQFGGDGNLFSVVMDSYNYRRALYDVLPDVEVHHVNKGGHIVLRPDSGDPVECVLMALDAADKIFGSTVNQKGYKVINNASVIQGDGIDITTVETILQRVLEKGFSAQCVTFGMGGGLLQKVNRDTMSFATKLSCVVNKLNVETNNNSASGDSNPRVQDQANQRNPVGYEEQGYIIRPVMKLPVTDKGKISLPGRLRVVQCERGLEIRPDLNILDHLDTPGVQLENKNSDDLPNVLQVVYNMRPIEGVWDSFDVVRRRVEGQWNQVDPLFNPIGHELQQEINKWSTVYIHTNVVNDPDTVQDAEKLEDEVIP